MEGDWTQHNFGVCWIEGGGQSREVPYTEVPVATGGATLGAEGRGFAGTCYGRVNRPQRRVVTEQHPAVAYPPGGQHHLQPH